MKKHKSVVAILLAVMMIFTMMPAMAFAAIDGDTPSADYKFSDDLSTIVTSSGVRYVGTVKTWDGNTGKVTVSYDPSENGSIQNPGITFSYYDLTGAEFLYGEAAIAKSYNGLATTDFTKLKLKMPSGVTKAAADTPETATVPISTIKTFVGENLWDGVVKMTVDGKEATSVEAKDAVQNVEITLDQTWSGTNNKKVTGAPAAATTVINAKKATAKSAVFFFDEVSETATQLSTTAAANTVPYDGAEHTIVMKPMDGYSVSYTVFNKKTGAEDAVSAVTVKDYLKEGMTVTATVTDNATAGKTEKVPYTFKGVNVTPAAEPSFVWASGTDMPYTMADNQEYDPYDYIVVKAGGAATDKAAQAAAKANEELLKGFFKDYYGVTATPNAVKTEGYTTVKLEVGSYSVKKAEDVDAKYTQMLANFGVDPVDGFTVPTTKAALTLAPADEYFEIEFVNSPTSKTYKAKVLKKKAKSFKVKAEATNGDEICYKLINAPQKIKINKKTGKITLKKGLKKGTYKITVKAYVPKSYTWSATYPCEYHKITIKVKK